MQLHRANQRFEAAGARLIVIGNGLPHFIAGFRERTGFDGEVYTDPGRRAYGALHLHRDLGSTFNLRTIRSAWRAFSAGNRQTRVQGDPWQQGGVFVVASDGEIVYGYASQHAGDHPPVEDLLVAAEDAASRAQAR